jgi:hypothetical protein
MKLVNEGYRFDAESYPSLKYTDVNETFVFGLSHSLLHITKSVGILAAELEGYDHGGSVNRQLLEEITLKQLVNFLKLASHLGITASQVSDYVREKYGTEQTQDTSRGLSAETEARIKHIVEKSM